MRITANHAIKILNQALKADQIAVSYLFSYRVKVSEKLKKHK